VAFFVRGDYVREIISGAGRVRIRPRAYIETVMKTACQWQVCWQQAQ